MAKVRVTPQTWNFKSFMRPIDGQHKMEGSPEKDGTLNQLCDHRWPT